jgi:hypothetical protein
MSFRRGKPNLAEQRVSQVPGSSHAGTSPTSNERHNKRKSGTRGSTASKRVSSPPAGTIPSASDITDEPNHNSKLEAAARLRVRCGYRPASVERATRVGVLDDLGLRIGGLFDDNVAVMSLDDLFCLEDLVAVDDREPA